jgi:hypothetical protein
VVAEPVMAKDVLASVADDRHVYVIPEYKVMFVSLAKNACTSMKWVMVELAGEDLRRFKARMLPFVSDEHAVHARGRFKKALRLDQLDPGLRAQIHPENGWFVFSIVRDPRARLFSAWQDKLLMQDSVYRRLSKRPWYPEFSTDPAVIAAQFAHFVDAMSAEPRIGLHSDRHFDSQTNLLHLDAVTYTRIYPIEQLAQLRTDLLDHVRPLGWSKDLAFRRTNDTPLRANAAVFAGDVRSKIEQIYAADFAAFGEFWDFARIEQVPDWSAAALQELELRVGFAQRLGDVRAIAKQHRERSDELSKRVAELETQLSRARRRTSVRTTMRRVIRRLRARLRPSPR